MLRFGIVDCDTSHVYQFARRLNHVDIEPEQWIEGARVVAAYPGTSRVTEPGRVSEYLANLRAAGVDFVERPEDLLGKVDAVLVTSNEGAVHRARATPFLEAGLPVYVDKPFTATAADARFLTELAERKGVPLFSASSLRFTPEVQAARAAGSELGPLVGADVFTPATLHPHNPGLLHYGVHGVEMLYTLLGTGCVEVSCIFNDDGEVVTGRWDDGRLGVVRGLRRGARGYGLTAYGERGIRPTLVSQQNLYKDLTAMIVAVLGGAPSPISAAELIEVVAFQEAALASARAAGKPAPVAT